jgi:hypothetical protein
MSKVIKAKVLRGRYELGRKAAAWFLTSGTRANIPVTDLEVLLEEIEADSFDYKNKN